MDGARFDRLTRTLSSRRRAVSRLLSGGLALLGLAASAGHMSAAPCPPGRKRCRGACIPKRFCCTDANCRPKATGKLCRNGRCACPPGEKVCRGRCIPHRQCCTSANCPAATRQTCQGGRCACPADRATLLNGSCGRRCGGAVTCAGGCFCGVGQEVPGEEFAICVAPNSTTPGWPPCAALLPAACASTAQCPAGYFCVNASPCSGAAYRCGPLCAV